MRAASPASASCRLPAVLAAVIGTRSMARIGPVSSDGSIWMTVTPVSESPASRARWIGAAPRQRGSSEACRLMQPRRASQGWPGQDQTVGGDHDEIRAQAGELLMLGGVLEGRRRAHRQPSRWPRRAPAMAAPSAAPGRPRRLRVHGDHRVRAGGEHAQARHGNAAVPMYTRRRGGALATSMRFPVRSRSVRPVISTTRRFAKRRGAILRHSRGAASPWRACAGSWSA